MASGGVTLADAAIDGSLDFSGAVLSHPPLERRTLWLELSNVRVGDYLMLQFRDPPAWDIRSVELQARSALRRGTHMAEDTATTRMHV